MEYVDSKGVSHEIAKMEYKHLMNARRKLERTPIMGGDATAAERMKEFGQRDKLVAAMKEEEARRNVAYAAAIGPDTPTEELVRALGDMNPERRQEPDWTPERQAVFDAVVAEAQRRKPCFKPL